MAKSVYTTFDISRYLAVDITTVMSWIDEGKIIAYKTPGGHRRVFHDDFLKFLDQFKIPVPIELKKKGLTILVVEDEPATLNSIVKFIKNMNSDISIETASDGFEAGQKIETISPNLIILDLNLPGVDGFRICKNIRSNKNKKNIKILAISGHHTQERKSKILKYGANDFIGKPFSPELLAEKIKTLLKIQSK